MKGLRLFYSYCHKDENFRKELEKWLTTFHGQGLISEWHDRLLLGGDNLKGEIKKKLQEAEIILLLLSQDYLASPSCMDEMALALSNVEKKRIVPIILKT
jgi:TIR domain